MEIASINNQSIRIKGKKTTFLLDPGSLTVKTPADAVIALHPDKDFALGKTEGARIIMQGPGEYEVGGVKISAIGSHTTFVYHLDIDGVQLLVGKAGSIESLQEKLKPGAVALICTDTVVKPTLIPALECRFVILYGQVAAETAKGLGKNMQPVSKVSITADKLPEETEIIVLG